MTLVCVRHSYRVAIYHMVLHSCVLWLLALIEYLLQLLEYLVLSHIGLACRHGIVLHHSIVLLHRRILLALTSATQLILRIVVLLASLFWAIRSKGFSSTSSDLLCLRVLPLKRIAGPSTDLILLRDCAWSIAALPLHHQAIVHFLVAHRHWVSSEYLVVVWSFLKNWRSLCFWSVLWVVRRVNASISRLSCLFCHWVWLTLGLELLLAYCHFTTAEHALRLLGLWCVVGIVSLCWSYTILLAQRLRIHCGNLPLVVLISEDVLLLRICSRLHQVILVVVHDEIGQWIRHLSLRIAHLCREMLLRLAAFEGHGCCGSCRGLVSKSIALLLVC